MLRICVTIRSEHCNGVIKINNTNLHENEDNSKMNLQDWWGKSSTMDLIL